MDENTTETQPVETETTATSETDTPVSDINDSAATASTEPGTETEPAVSDEPHLYAGKYDSPEKLEDGYKSQSKYIQELQSKIDEYQKQIEAQKEEAKAIKLQEAKNKGFNSVEEHQISQKVILREFELYANSLDKIAPENYDRAIAALQNYYATANQAYLNEAKQYFPDEIIENIAIEKQNYKNNLTSELQHQNALAAQKSREALCSQIETNFKDFLTDVICENQSERNSAKSEALAAMFNLGAIQSIEDMSVFVNLYNSIADNAVKNYVNSLQAQNAVNAVKTKSQILTGHSDIPKKADINSKEFWDEFYAKS